MRLLRSRRQKIILAVALVCLILILASFVYIEILVASLHSTTNNPTLQGPRVTTYLNYQGLVNYRYGNYEYPLVSLNYSTYNAVLVYANASIYKYPIPAHLYILNFSDECIPALCGNATAAADALMAGIRSYGMTDLLKNTSYVNVANLDQIGNDSILVILNGLIPIELEAGNFSLLQSLLDRHTSIIYVGQNFSSMVISGPSPTQQPTSGLPQSLYTRSTYGSGAEGLHIQFADLRLQERHGLPPCHLRQ